jgi:hypothetical protein
MTRCAAIAVAALAAVGCSERSPTLRGIETRVFVDRTEARVGDPVGVTVEIDTPEGFAVEPAASPPSDEGFFTERVERLEPVGIPGGVRHRVLWVLRARTPGDHALPELSVPLAWPDGRLQRLAVGGVPVPVRSVHADLPDQETYFDIRPAPALERRPLWPWVAGGSVLLAALGSLFLVRVRRAATAPEPPAPALLARETLAAIEGALLESDPRALAAQLVGPLRELVRRRWRVEGEAWTPQELPPEVDAPIASALRSIDAERFAASPRREALVQSALSARAYLRDVADPR